MLLSPALGASQLCVAGVELKCREGVLENGRRLGEVVGIDGDIERALRAVHMPEDGQLDGNGELLGLYSLQHTVGDEGASRDLTGLRGAILGV